MKETPALEYKKRVLLKHDNPAQKLQERYCINSLERCIQHNNFDGYMYGVSIPSVSSRFSRGSEYDYYGQMFALYVKHLEDPELDIPKMVEDSLYRGLDPKNVKPEPGSARYYSRIKNIYHVLNAHLILRAEQEATFDIPDDIYKKTKEIVLKNKDTLMRCGWWDSIIHEDEIATERIQESVFFYSG